MKRALLLTGALALCACHPGGTSPPSGDPFAGYAYASGPPSPKTKVFLIAGGDDVANFAAEVLEQRTLWRRAGLGEDEIACYWARPSREGLAEDREQYEAIALALRSCRAASPGQIVTDIRAAAEASDETGFVYVFVSSHGLASQLRSLEQSDHPRTQQFVASLSTAERAVLEPAAIALEAGDGPSLGEPRAVVAGLRAGAPPEWVVFTPATLGPLLAAFPDDVRKVVVLQACFSGGFIDHHARSTSKSSAGADALLAVPNLTVLTATAAERPSFGCGPGESRTFFGGTINVALERALAEHDPADLPWQDIYEDVVFAIEAMEAVQGQDASKPGFVDTARTDPPDPSASHGGDAADDPDAPRDATADGPGGSVAPAPHRP